MSLSLWQQPAPVDEKQSKEIPEEIINADNLWEQSLELILSQGFCYWKCDLFNGDIIKLVLNDSIKSTRYPVWTLEEILAAWELPAATLKLIQAAKRRRTGARIISVEDRK